MSTDPGIRKTVAEHIALLASSSAQLEYERQVPTANVFAELISGFCDDLYHPKSPAFLEPFTEDELKDLAVLYGLLYAAAKLRDASVADLLKTPEWRAVIAFAKELKARFTS